MNVTEAAKAAAKARIAVLPAAEDGSKRPGVGSWAKYQERLPTRDELRAWFTREQPAGLGFVTGRVSGGLEMFEFDSDAAYQRFQERAIDAGLEALIDQVEDGYSERTPSGGVHWLYRVAVRPEEVPPGNTKLASDANGKTIIETRGEGGWVVVAPSSGPVHPSGEPYVLINGGPGKIAHLTTGERDELWALARSLDEAPKPVDGGPAPEPGEDKGTRPGDFYDQQATWDEILLPNGWTRIFERRGEVYWRRPGARTRGIDATTGAHGHDYLYVFSTSAWPFEAEQGYSKFRAYALLNHDGDWAAAARDLKGQGYALPDPAPLRPTREAKKPAAAPTSPVDDGPVSDSGGTPPDDEFIPIFPPDHFVSVYIDYVRKRTDASFEYHEAAALTLLAAATPGVKARLTPWPKGLPTCLYVLLVGDTTRSRKSTVLNNAEDILGEAIEGARISDQFSPEAFIEQLASRPGQPAVWLVDEFGEQIDAMHHKQYMAGIKGLLLQVYGGKDFEYRRHSKRVKGSANAVEDVDRVRDPHLCVIGATTPAIFDGLSSKDIDTGLLPRFGIVMPRTRPPRLRATAVPPKLEEERKALVEFVGALHEWCSTTAPMVEFDEDAEVTLDEFQERIEQSGQPILARLPEMAYKLAMLASLGEEIPEYGAALTVTNTHALLAVGVLSRWWRSALDFADRIGGLNVEERKFQQRAERAVRFVEESGGEAQRRDVMRRLKLRARDMDDVEQTLVQQGRIVVDFGEKEEGEKGPAPKVWRTA